MTSSTNQVGSSGTTQSASVPISELGCKLLEQNRESLNQRYLQRRAQGAKLEDIGWLFHLRHRVLPIVEAVALVLPEGCTRTLNDLYDVSLDLFAVGHFSETTGLLPQALSQLWEFTLPRLAKQLARDPRRVTGSLSNAVLSIAQSRPESVERWLSALNRAGPLTTSVEQLLQIGKVSAWYAGYPEYRTMAVELAQSLPAEIVKPLFQLPASLRDNDVSELLVRWQADPWACRLETIANSSAIARVSSCGDFRGFGGVFLQPPQVFLSEQQLMATDNHSVWQVIADSFGQTFHRVDLMADVSRRKPRKGVPQIDAHGLVTWSGHTLSCPELANSTSQAFDGRTLAVTLRNSFHLFLIAAPKISKAVA